jgi:hypothetical protein
VEVPGLLRGAVHDGDSSECGRLRLRLDAVEAVDLDDSLFVPLPTRTSMASYVMLVGTPAG